MLVNICSKIIPDRIRIKRKIITKRREKIKPKKSDAQTTTTRQRVASRTGFRFCLRFIQRVELVGVEGKKKK